MWLLHVKRIASSTWICCDVGTEIENNRGMDVTCKYCQQSFHSYPSKKRVFCSRECRSESMRGKPVLHLVGKHGVKPRKRTISECAVCGEPFEHHTARAAKYCSKACWSRRNPMVLARCMWCNIEFWAYKSFSQVHCSRTCFSYHQREAQKGEKSHFWKGGLTDLNQLLRSRAEYNDWRELVFRRDSYQCQKCGIKSKTGTRVYLQAHHIQPWAKFPELRYEPTNGITLCRNCHQTEHEHRIH